MVKYNKIIKMVKKNFNAIPFLNSAKVSTSSVAVCVCVCVCVCMEEGGRGEGEVLANKYNTLIIQQM